MSSRSRQSKGKEEWVSAGNYKFDTPRRATRITRRRGHLSIPSPWTKKANTHHARDQVGKSQIKKLRPRRNARKQVEKKVKILLKQDVKSPKEKSKSPIIKDAFVSLSSLNIQSKTKSRTVKDAVSTGKGINGFENDMDIEYRVDVPARKSGLAATDKVSPKASSLSTSYKQTGIKSSKGSGKRGRLTFSNEIMEFILDDDNKHNKSIKKLRKGKKETNVSPSSEMKKHDLLDEEYSDKDSDSSESLKDENVNDHTAVSKSNKSIEELTPEEKTKMEDGTKSEDKTTSEIPEGKPVRSWCSIA